MNRARDWGIVFGVAARCDRGPQHAASMLFTVRGQREETSWPVLRAAALGTGSRRDLRAVERVCLDPVKRAPVVEHRTAVRGGSRPINGRPPNLARRDVFLLDDLTVGGVEMAEIACVEQV